jgi:glycine/D-amino acid oxidase-like deaminating enzyme
MVDDPEVVVIGGGVTGCATAWELARAGTSVTLVERYDLNTQASGRNAGGLHGQIQNEPFLELGEEWARSFAPALTLMRDAIRHWLELEVELGVDLEVNVSGGLYVASTEAQLRDLERKAAIERSLGSGAEVLSRGELQRVAPYVSERLLGGLLCELEGKANPLLAAPALARAAVEHGARLLLQTEVRSVEPTRTGFRVETSAGPLSCGRIVDCSGTDVGRLAGRELPVERWPIQVYATEAVPPLVTHLLYYAGGQLTLKQARFGTLLIGGGWPSQADGRVDLASLRGNLRLAIEVVPEVSGASLLRAWTGVCPGVADQLPIVGEVAPGYIVALFPFLGFTCGPLLGRIAARLARGEDPGRDLAPFSPARF